jgi:hypothetical protein
VSKAFAIVSKMAKTNVSGLLKKTLIRLEQVVFLKTRVPVAAYHAAAIAKKEAGNVFYLGKFGFHGRPHTGKGRGRAKKAFSLAVRIVPHTVDAVAVFVKPAVAQSELNELQVEQAGREADREADHEAEDADEGVAIVFPKIAQRNREVAKKMKRVREDEHDGRLAGWWIYIQQAEASYS